MGPRDDCTTGRADLHHRSSANHSNNNRESLRDSLSQPTMVSLQSTPKKESEQRLLVGARRKSISPLRQSFQNLFSVFTKRGGNLIRENIPTENNTGCVVTQQFNPGLSTECHNKPAQVNYSGPLFYLSRIPGDSSDANVSSEWIPCIGTLVAGTIVVSGLKDTSTRTISLTQCADIRSLSLDQLNHAEKAVLPQAVEHKLFEILFEGRPREKFAVRSVSERAAWICAIWDVIITKREVHDPHPIRDNPLSSNSSRLPISVEVTPCPTPQGMERSLSPVPMGSDMSMTQESSSIGQQTGSVSLFREKSLSVDNSGSSSIPIPPRLASSSIANLSSRSVVKQRLAQIEQGSSRLTTPVLSSMSGSVTSTPQGIHQPIPSVSRICSGLDPQCNDDNSILDFYNDVTSPGNDHQRHSSAFCSPTTPAVGEKPYQTANLDRSLFLGYQSSMIELGCEKGQGSPVQVSAYHHQLASLTEQVLSVQHDVHDIRQIVSNKGTELKRLGNVHQKVAAIEHRLQHNQDQLSRVEAKMDRFEVPSHVSYTATPEIANMMKKLDEFPARICNDIQALSSKVDQAITCQSSCATQGTSLERGQSAGTDELHQKIDELLRQSRYISTHANAQQSSAQWMARLEETLSTLKTALGELSIQDQQTDSVRYLNELNAWLESFVTNGTSQIHGIAQGVELLCQELGCINESAADCPGGNSKPRPGILSDFRQLLVEARSREHSTAELQSSIARLTTLIYEQRLGEASQGMITPETVMQILAQQQTENGNLLKALTAEISSEIRGERLRFVEAMKEATAINIQNHVEQFKEELTKEVIAMTKEVGRLHREKQVMENQIAELFAFYTKHQQIPDFVNAKSIPSLRRPLPYPRIVERK